MEGREKACSGRFESWGIDHQVELQHSRTIDDEGIVKPAYSERKGYEITKPTALFLPLGGAPFRPSTYALPFTPRTALLAPICCDGFPERGEIFLCEPCLGLNLDYPPLS